MASEKAAAEFQLEKEVKHLQEAQLEAERNRASRRTSTSWEEDTDMKTREFSEHGMKRKKNKSTYSVRPYKFSFYRRSWWSKTKVRSYKFGQRAGPMRVSTQGYKKTYTRSTGRIPTRRTFKRAHTRANESSTTRHVEQNATSSLIVSRNVGKQENLKSLKTF